MNIFICPKLRVDGYEISISDNLKDLGVKVDIGMVSEKVVHDKREVTYSQVLYAASLLVNPVENCKGLRNFLKSSTKLITPPYSLIQLSFSGDTLERECHIIPKNIN